MFLTNLKTVRPAVSHQKIDVVLQQVANDLTDLAQKSTEAKKKLRQVSDKTGIHLKTLNRIVRLENKPSHLTVFKIYQYLTQKNDQDEVLNACPEIVRKYLAKGLSSRLEKNLSFQQPMTEQIQTNPVFGEIYVLCAAGVLPEQEILRKFGEYGLEVVQEMVANRNLIRVKKHYTLGPNQIYLSPECILSLGLLTTKKYAKPKSGYEHKKHFMNFIVEGLNEKAYQQWLDLDNELYQKKLELAKNPLNLGTKQVFTFNVTDTLEPKELL